MKLSCTRDNLHQGLSIVSHLTTKNVNLPILQNVLIKAEGGAMTFTTTNLEIAIGCAVRGKVEEVGECTVPSKLFFDYVSLLPNENVSIETEGSTLFISCGSYQTKMNGMAASEFPLVPRVKGDQTFSLPVDPLRQALSQVLFAVASNESRPELTGVFIQFEEGEQGTTVTLAATDSYRLSECIFELPSIKVGNRKVIIPAKTLAEVSRILSIFKDGVESPSEVTLSLSDSQAVFTYGSVELISRTIDGNYPDYRQIIPKQFDTQGIIDRDDFVKAVKTASLFSRTGLFDVMLSFDPKEKQVSVRSVDATRGENTAACGADITGVGNNVTVNYRYLLDGLNALSSERVLFKMIDAGNPCLVTPHGVENRSLYIVMPIKQ